jgi:hypothetical protein
MAFTKHEKLVRAIKNHFDILEDHYRKTAALLNALQLFFYKPFQHRESPDISDKTFDAMSNTHRWGMKMFGATEQLRSAAEFFPCYAFALPLNVYLKSTTFESREGRFVPWGVVTILPSHTLQQLKEAKLEAVCYCASSEERTEWIDWFDREDRAETLTNRVLIEIQNHQDKAIVEENLLQEALPYFLDAACEFFGDKFDKVIKTLEKSDFAPREETTVRESYERVENSIRERKKRYFEELGFKRAWRDYLQALILADLNCNKERAFKILEEYFPSKTSSAKKQDTSRDTGRSIDRRTYGAFICHFANRSSTSEVDGEITLLLWIAVHIAQRGGKRYSIKRLLRLTKANISGRNLIIGQDEIEFSCGLASILQEYLGDTLQVERHRPLFPNLTRDRLIDCLRRASAEILPPGSIPALPEAFLSFPHSQKNLRFPARERLRQQQNPAEIIQRTLSRAEIKRQLGMLMAQKNS